MLEIKMTVIVPTYKDVEGTNKCIAALSNQSLSSNLFEVIIVDNNPVPLDYDLMPDNFSLLHEPCPGSYSARNSALKKAKGKYIAFTDSDCIVANDWLEKGLLYLDKGIQRIAGKILLHNEPGREINSFASSYEKGFAFNQEENVSRGESVTANLMINRKIIDLIGDFDSKLFSGGDVEWNRRASKTGIAIEYADDVIVSHPIRSSIREITNKRIRVIGGQFERTTYLQSLKFLVPPFKDIPYLKNKKEMKNHEKFSSWLVRYYLKIVSFIYIILLKMKFVMPRRA